MNCPNCQAELAENAAFCAFRGHPVTQQTDSPSVCKSCGRIIENTDSAFCPGCGTPLNGTSQGAAAPGQYSYARQQYQQPAILPLQAGWQNMNKHLLLFIFTLGIWNLIWIYRMTAYLNRGFSAPVRNPVTQLLLCIFVPFYQVFWYRASASIVDEMARSQGVGCDLTQFCTLAGFFAPVAAAMMLQSKINEIIIADRAW